MFCTATNRAIVLIISFTFSAAIIHDVCGFTPICKHFWARRLPIGKIVSRCNYHPTRCMSVQKRSSAPSVKAKIQRGALALGDTRSFASLGDIGDILQESNSEENNTNLEWKQQLLQKYRGLMAFWQQNFFIVGMAIGVTLSKLNPSLGVTGTTPERILSKYGVFLVFFLSGLSLQLRDLKASLLDLRLNLLIQLWSLVVWPCLIGLPTIVTLRSCVASNRYPLLSKFLPTQQLLDGILITTCLPTTINMCVFLSSAANANVATALCNAILGNLLGIFVTPAWLLHFFGGSTTKNQGPLIELPFPTMVSKLCAKVLLPVSVGQSLRGMPKIQDWYKSHSQFFKRASELCLIGIAWSAFCNAFHSRGLASGGASLTPTSLLSLLAILLCLHTFTVWCLFHLFQLLGYTNEVVVAATFTASHKTMAFGLPLIKVIFEGSPNLASYCTPVMMIHPLQLSLGSIMVPWFKSYISKIRNKKGSEYA